MSHETRSRAAAGERSSPWAGLAAVPAVEQPPGVGGRQRTRVAPAGGGGYLDGRTGREVRADPRLRELVEIGLAPHWLEIAHTVGYDAFIAVWRLLSAAPELRDDDDQIELRLRPFRSYERYQRNRYIDTLVAGRLKPSVIHEMVSRDLGEQLSYRHIKRLAAASRQRSGIGEPAATAQQSPVPPRA